MTNLIPLGIAFIPDPTSIDYLVRLNREILNVSSSEFILQNENILLPHASLFQGQFEKIHLNTLIRILDNTRTLIKNPIILKSVGLNLWGNKICFLDLVVNEELSMLQKNFIIKMDPLRDRNSGSADTQKLENLSEEEQFSMDQFSYPFSGPAFRPHFTVGPIAGISHFREIQNWISLNPTPYEFKFDFLCLFEVGKYGRLESIQHQVQI